MKPKILEINKSIGNGLVPVYFSINFEESNNFWAVKRNRLSALVALMRINQYNAIREKGDMRTSLFAEQFRKYYLDTDR